MSDGRKKHGASLLLPCFVAACEALEPDLQDQLSELMLTIGRYYLFLLLLKLPKKYGNKERLESEDYTISWLMLLIRICVLSSLSNMFINANLAFYGKIITGMNSE